MDGSHPTIGPMDWWRKNQSGWNHHWRIRENARCFHRIIQGFQCWKNDCKSLVIEASQLPDEIDYFSISKLFSISITISSAYLSQISLNYFSSSWFDLLYSCIFQVALTIFQFPLVHISYFLYLITLLNVLETY